MTKQSGLGDNLYVGGYDLSGDINSLGRIGGGPAALDVTGIDKSAMERLGGRRDGSMEFLAYFNDTAGQAHPRLGSLPTTDVHLMYCRGTTADSPAALLVAKQIGYDGERDDEGNLRFSVEAQSNGYGIEWGQLMTAGKRTDTAATNGSSVDFGTGSTSFGLQAYLQVFSFTGTDATVKIQESSDDAVGDPFADVTGGGFTQITSGPTTQRIETTRALTVERYLRVVTVTTGGFSNLVFAVAIVRNDTSVVF